MAKEKPPIFGMAQRGGAVVIRMPEDVKQATIGPLIERTIAAGSTVYTDGYTIYSRLTEWGYGHETVCHAAGEYARDDDGDGPARSMSTRPKGSGRCCVRGAAPTVGSRRRRCLCSWASSSSCTTSGLVARGGWVP